MEKDYYKLVSRSPVNDDPVLALVAPVCKVNLVLAIKLYKLSIISRSFVMLIVALSLEGNEYLVAINVDRHAVSIGGLKAVTHIDDVFAVEIAANCGDLNLDGVITIYTTNGNLTGSGKSGSNKVGELGRIGVVVALSRDNKLNYDTLILVVSINVLASILAISGSVNVSVIGIVKRGKNLGLNAGGVSSTTLRAYRLDKTLGSSGGLGYDYPSAELVTGSGCALNGTSHVASLVLTYVTVRNLKRNLLAGADSCGGIDGGLPSSVYVTGSRISLGIGAFYATNGAVVNPDSGALTCATGISSGIKAILPITPIVINHRSLGVNENVTTVVTGMSSVTGSGTSRSGNYISVVVRKNLSLVSYVAKTALTSVSSVTSGGAGRLSNNCIIYVVNPLKVCAFAIKAYPKGATLSSLSMY